MTWVTLAWNTSEMLFASAQVIHHRLSRMAAAGAIPSRQDQQEFILMGQEKVEAAAESLQAIALRIGKMNQEIGLIVFRQMLSGTGGLGMTLPALGHIGIYSNLLPAKLLSDATARSAALTAQVNRSIASIAQHGLRPIYTRARANARRLKLVNKSKK